MKKTLLLFSLLTIALSTFSNDYLITKYGVGTDSTKLCTKDIQKVIDKAAKKGGGTIVVPKGVFLTGALFFKPNTRLKLMEGAVIKGSENIADYPFIPSRMEGKNINYYAALINAYSVDSFSITGSGTINGNALRFWKQFWAYRDSLKKIGQYATNLDVHRPRLVFIWGCNNVKISGVRLCNSGYWTTHLYKCNEILIENCDIRSPEKPVPAPSTDGIDLDVCSNVVIRCCYIAVNDDAVCIKGGKGPTAQTLPENGIVENVLIENCTFGLTHSSLTLGSESVHAKNITMRNCKINHHRAFLSLKMRPDTYQTYENITIDGISGTCGTFIKMEPWTQFFNMEGSREKPYGIVRNITISNVNLKCTQFGIMSGNPADSVSNIIFKDIKLSTGSNSFKSKYKDIKFENVTVNGAPIEVK